MFFFVFSFFRAFVIRIMLHSVSPTRNERLGPFNPWLPFCRDRATSYNVGKGA
jgi:hypothetical protein